MEDEIAIEMKKMGRESELAVKSNDVPDHYSAGIEPIKFIQSHSMSFAAGNVVKYICRYKHKGQPLEDLNKARHYIDLLLREIEE